MSTTYSVGVNSADAQLGSLTKTAKSKGGKFATYYLPMLVMLGIGMIALILLRNLDEKSGDFITFIVGAVIYLLSVVMSWTGEMKKFDKLPDEIDKDAQVGALKAQKQSIEDVIKMAERRLKFQTAATAVFAAAGVWAVIMGIKRKAQSAQAQAATESAAVEVDTKCTQQPEFMLQPPMIGAPGTPYTGMPGLGFCQTVSTATSGCLRSSGRLLGFEETMSSSIYNPGGSFNFNQNYWDLRYDRWSLEEYCSPLSLNMNQDDTMNFSPNRNSYLKIKEMQERFKGKTLFEIHHMEPQNLHSKNAPTYMQRIFSEEELKDFTEEEISLLNDLKININIIDFVISEAHANAVTNTILRSGTKKATSTLTDNVDPRAAARSEINGEVQAANQEATGLAGELCAQAMGAQCGSEEVLFYMQAQNFLATEGTAAASARLVASGSKRLANATLSEATQRRILGAVSDQAAKLNAARVQTQRNARAVQRRTQRQAARQAATTVGKLVARRAGQAALVSTAATVALAAGAAPVVVAMAGLALTAYGVYETGKAAYEVYQAFSRTTAGQEFEAGVKAKWDSFWSENIYPGKQNFLEQFMNYVFPKANALGGAMLGVGGLTVAAGIVISKVASEGANEMNNFFYNPEGRAVIYGAITALTALIMMSTKKMIDNLKEDRDKLDGLIKQYETRFQESSFFDGFDKFELSHLFIDEAEAAQRQSNKLPFKFPCLMPTRSGACGNLAQAIQKRMPPGLTLPTIVLNTIKQSTGLVRSIQRTDRMPGNTDKVIDQLAKDADVLQDTFSHSKKMLNKSRVNQHKVAPIPFGKWERVFNLRMSYIAKREIKKQNLDFEEIASALTGGYRPRKDDIAKDLEKLIEEGSSDDERSNVLEKEIAINPAKKKGVVMSEHFNENNEKDLNMDYAEVEYEQADAIHQDKDLDLFKIISRRYILLRKSHLGK